MYTKGEQLKIHRRRDYGFNVSVIDVELIQGQCYWFGNILVQMIKVTPRGFNLLDLAKSRCIFYRPFYQVGKYYRINGISGVYKAVHVEKE